MKRFPETVGGPPRHHGDHAVRRIPLLVSISDSSGSLEPPVGGGAFGPTVLVFQHGYGGALFGLGGRGRRIWAVRARCCVRNRVWAVDGLRVFLLRA